MEKRTITFSAIILAILLSAGYLIYISGPGTEETEPQLSEDEKYCLAVIGTSQESCDGLLIIFDAHDCNTQVLMKKAIIEKNPTYCDEIEKYNESEFVKDNIPYKESCYFIAMSKDEIQNSDCGGFEDRSKILCEKSKKAVLDMEYNASADDSLSEREMEIVISQRAYYYQDSSFCSGIKSKVNYIFCILLTTGDTGFCQEFEDFRKSQLGTTLN